jgi:hypothetical protein
MDFRLPARQLLAAHFGVLVAPFKGWSKVNRGDKRRRDTPDDQSGHDDGGLDLCLHDVSSSGHASIQS